MSFWDNVKKFAQPYSDSDYDDYDEDEEYLDDEYEEEASAKAAPRRSARPARRAPEPEYEDEEEEDDSDYGFAPMATTTTTAAPAVAPSGFNGQVLNMHNGQKQDIVLFRPGSFNDTSKAADDLRNRRAVIGNMENVDKAMARRVVDFLSGCVYALDGDVKKIAQSAYLFCPHNMDILGDLETIQAEVESYI